MLPVFGRPLKAKRDTQSSEHGLVATEQHHRFKLKQQRKRGRIVPG